MICWKSGVGAKFRKRSHNARQPLEMSGKITLCCQIQFWDCTINPSQDLAYKHSSLIINNCYYFFPIQFSKCSINPSQVSNYLLFITIQYFLLPSPTNDFVLSNSIVRSHNQSKSSHLWCGKFPTRYLFIGPRSDHSLRKLNELT